MSHHHGIGSVVSQCGSCYFSTGWLTLGLSSVNEFTVVSVSHRVNEGYGGAGEASGLGDRAATQALNCCSVSQWCGRADRGHCKQADPSPSFRKRPSRACSPYLQSLASGPTLPSLFIPLSIFSLSSSAPPPLSILPVPPSFCLAPPHTPFLPSSFFSCLQQTLKFPLLP